MKRMTSGPIAVLVKEGSMSNAISGPVFKRYTLEMRTEMDRTRMEIRGKDGLEDQTRIAASRLREILNDGARPTEAEHRAICRGLPRMKHFQHLLLEWDRDSLPSQAPPQPPQSRREVRVEPEATRETTPSPEPPKQEPKPEAKLAVPPLRPRTFGESLRACREAEGCRQEDVANMCDVSSSAVAQWELDNVAPVTANYKKLLEVFPALAVAPKPNVRDIPVPVGNVGSRMQVAEVSAASQQSAASPPPSNESEPPRFSSQAFIKFGFSLASTLPVLGKNKSAVVSLLRAGSSAGMTVEAIISALEMEA